MKRAELEHLIRVSAAITGDEEIVIIGSQSILGQFPTAPDELCASDEADVYPRFHPELADLVEGTIGELSPFHETFGYCARGVSPETATLPRGWDERLIAVQNAGTRNAIGWCLEIHDLAIAKYVASRDDDLEFLTVAIRHQLVDRATLEARLRELEVDADTRTRIAAQIAADYR